MKAGDLRRWRFPDEMPPMFNGAAIFMVTDVRERDESVDFLVGGKHVRSWSLDWVYKHSEPVNETG
jgi:hypothetical protein